MDRTQIIDEELNAVAAHLRERREAILDAWRVAADADPQLTTTNALPQSLSNELGTTFRVILPRCYQPEPPE